MTGQRAPPGRAAYVLAAVGSKAAEAASAQRAGAAGLGSGGPPPVHAPPMAAAPPPVVRHTPLSDDFFQAETKHVPGTVATALTHGQRSAGGGGTAGFSRSRLGIGHGMPLSEFSEQATLPSTSDPFGPKFWQALAEEGPGSAAAPPAASPYGTPASTYTTAAPDPFGRERKLGEADADRINRERKERDEEISRRLQQGRGGGGSASGSSHGMPLAPPGMPPTGMPAPPGYAEHRHELSVREQKEASAGLMMTRPLGVAPPTQHPGMRF
jgi:hypothetical protein